MTRFKQAAAGENGSKWLTPREVAEYFQTGVELIYDACAAGELKTREARISNHSRAAGVG